MNTLNDALDSTGPWGDDAMGKAQEVFYMCKVGLKIINVINFELNNIFLFIGY